MALPPAATLLYGLHRLYKSIWHATEADRRNFYDHSARQIVAANWDISYDVALCFVVVVSYLAPVQLLPILFEQSLQAISSPAPCNCFHQLRRLEVRHCAERLILYGGICHLVVA
jgi:hypothetical protein